MHYKNGRPANNGDKIVFIGAMERPISGILYDAKAGNDYCNGMLAPFGGGSHIGPNLGECYHLDDFMAAIPADIPDTSSPVTTEASV